MTIDLVEPDPPSAAAGAIEVPDGALVLLVGPSGSGKSTFARRHFRPAEVLSSDAFRAMVSDDENDQAATPDAFRLLALGLDARLKRRRLTVVDATNLKREDRASLVSIARARRAPLVAIVFDLPPRVLEFRRTGRLDRRIPGDALERQLRTFRDAAPALRSEGFESVHVLSSEAAVDAARVERRERAGRRALPAGRGEPSRGRGRETDVHALPGGDAAIDRRGDRGPFDLIGDVHGCVDELVALLRQLGYEVKSGAAAGARGGDGSRATGQGTAAGPGAATAVRVVPPPGRTAVLLGDMVDRGPATPDVLRLAMALARDGAGFAVLGNHDWKLLRWLWGRNVRISHGLAESIAQLGDESDAFQLRVREFLESLPTQLVLDEGRLIVAHAGVTEPLQGQTSKRAREFALFGETTGEIDEFGLPVRINWAKRYRGDACVVYGHTPVLEPEWVNDTIDIDTGCVFGGRLTALRWPERELVSVPAARVYYESARPLLERIDHHDYLGGRPDRDTARTPAATE